MATEISIRAHTNCDDAYVVWRYPQVIPGCRGFALFRKPTGGEPEPVQTFVPFSGEAHASGEHRPSTEWPIQKFSWTDVFAHSGQELSYRVVPMVGKAGALEQAEDQASPWSDPVSVGPRVNDQLSAYFNRGVLATQAVARRLKGEEPWTKQLGEMIKTPGDSTRDYLSGELRVAMLELLKAAQARPQATLYAALFELDDPELIAALCAFGARAHVILANGTDANGDENADARKELEAQGVDVHKRMTGSRLAHNKFLVFCEPDATAQRVWTGSTNWTMTGLCTQVNNGVLIESADVATYYKRQWEALLKAGDKFPDELVDGNGSGRDAGLGEGSIETWFVPVHKQVDLDAARALIAAAKQGVLFLMFNPGQKETLFNAIMERADPTSAKYDADLYVHGVLNQDPEAGSKDPAMIGLIHRGQLDPADPDIVLPSKVDERFAAWDKEIERYNIVMVHSKVIVIDPFGDEPVVMTGSHNLGTRASKSNDDNLNLIKGEPGLAAAYATNIISVYNNYRWRYVNSESAKKAGKEWDGPEDDASWQDPYFSDDDAEAKQRELRFWLGE